MDRRRFLSLVGALGAGALGRWRAQAAEAKRSPKLKGSIEDIWHVVILMQENRAFDHYFGTLRGVRGYGDPHPALLPGGRPIWRQSQGTLEVHPFHPEDGDLGMKYIIDLPHDWRSTHQTFNFGRYDQWLPYKSPSSMAFLERADIPWHWALADAFTICDSYFCSVLGPTLPNRYFMFTGCDGNEDPTYDPDLHNGEGPFLWRTYPERLSEAGVTWRIYQDAGTGLDDEGGWGDSDDPFIGNYGDNGLLNFDVYRKALPGSDLYERSRRGTNAREGQDLFEIFRRDVETGRLPQVSWIVAPQAYTEHGNWPANYGAWYSSQVLGTLMANPEVWAHTAFILTYDENDGLFDHLVPPHPPVTSIPGASTVDVRGEFYNGDKDVAGVFGLGVRVPTIVASPWSAGGWVCSEVFDHTSIVRFLERRFGVMEPNITPWRRSVCGDLTSAFDFSQHDPRVPTLPDTTAWKPRDRQKRPDYIPGVPALAARPRQEAGDRPARPLAYDLAVGERIAGDVLVLSLDNRGKLGAHLQVRSVQASWLPHTYTLGAGTKLDAELPLEGEYDYQLHGANGFYRRYAGRAPRAEPQVSLAVKSSDRSLQFKVVNPATEQVVLQVGDVYGKAPLKLTIPPRATRSFPVATRDSAGWYDLSLTVLGIDDPWLRQYAGHIEDGKPSRSDPQLGR